MNEISETVATTPANDSLSDNPEGDSSSDTSDFIDYFPETQSEKGTNTDDENASNDSEEEESSDDEYDHELHERLTREEIARIAKLEDKTSTKPDLEDYFPEEEANEVKPVDENATNDLDKIIMEVLEHETYFDDPVVHFSDPMMITNVTPVTA